MTLAPSDRRRLVTQIRASRSDIADRITVELLSRHPGSLDRHGEAAAALPEDDVSHHLDFLTGALLSRETAPFEGYAAWASRVRASRGMASDDLIEKLEEIRRELGHAFTEGDGALIHRYLTAGIEAVKASERTPEEPPARSTPLVNRYLDAVLASDRRGALALTEEALDAGKSVAEIYLDVLTPAQHEIGRMWAGKEVSVGQEHVATAITQYVVAQLYPRLQIPEPTRGPAVVTGVPGELHQIGGHMVADFLETDGWDVRFLGTHLPNREILDAVESHGAGLLAVSATMLANVPTVCELVEEARVRFDDLRVLVGGQAFRGGSWEDVGADGVGLDVTHAVELARSLVPST